MLRLTLALLIVGADPPAFPRTAPPRFALITETDRADGTITVQTSSVTLTTRKVDPKAAKEPDSEPKLKRVVVTYRLDMKHFRVSEAGGKVIKGDEVWKRLKPGTMILHQSEGVVDSAFRKLIAKDALIVEAPPKE
jgi:hypothetical protein